MKRAFLTQLIAVGVAAAAETIDDKKTRAVVGLATMFSALAVSNGNGRDVEAEGRQAVVAPSLVVDVGRGPLVELVDQTLLEQAGEGSIQRAGVQGHRTTRAVPHLPHDAIAVLIAGRQGKEHLERLW